MVQDLPTCQILVQKQLDLTPQLSNVTTSLGQHRPTLIQPALARFVVQLLDSPPLF
jgi:hypothetical protein